MKKIFSTLFLAVVLTTGLVAETKMFSVNFTVPFDIHTQKVSGYGETQKATEKITSIGFGLSGVNMFSEVVGLYMDVSLVFFQSLKYDNPVVSYSMKRSDMVEDAKQFSMDLRIGPAFKIIDNDKMFLSAAPVFFCNFVYWGNPDSAIAISGGFVGLGANASFSYFFNSFVGISAGLDIDYGFVGFGDYKKVSDSGATSKHSQFNITPKIGVAFKF
ncbi:MAG: hypothetical protein IKK80_07895 [Treponema sp.]|nr:hypothetical protein [Treponema sp.]